MLLINSLRNYEQNDTECFYCWSRPQLIFLGNHVFTIFITWISLILSLLKGWSFIPHKTNRMAISDLFSEPQEIQWKLLCFWLSSP